MEVDLTDNNGKVLEKTKIDFVSPQVDSALQGILVKAPVHSTSEILRNAQMVKARVIWSTKPMAVVPVLAVTRQGGQSFVFVAQQQNGHFMAVQTAVTLGDTVGNTYSILSGLNAGRPGDRLGHAVSGQRNAGNADGRLRSVSRTFRMNAERMGTSVNVAGRLSRHPD